MVVRVVARWVLTGVLGALLSGCGGGKPSDARTVAPVQSEKVAQSPERDMDDLVERMLAKLSPYDASKDSFETPDNAVKAWWRWIDSQEEIEATKCAISQKAGYKWMTQSLPTLATAEHIERLMVGQVMQCEVNKYRRSIDEVKVESDTRSVVFATVWRAGEPPAKAREREVKAAKEGSKFKYVLEKVDRKWVLSDVLRQTKSGDKAWERVSDGLEFVFYSGEVYRQ